MGGIDTTNEQGVGTDRISESFRRFCRHKIHEDKTMKFHNRYRVLYVEDDEDACFMLSTLLGFSDIDVSVARSVREAYQLAQNERFDLYLLDNEFPNGSGLELCRQLREFNPQTPIVFYSGNAYETDKQKGLAAGANAYLVKPDSDIVAETIFRLIPQTTATARRQEKILCQAA